MNAYIYALVDPREPIVLRYIGHSVEPKIRRWYHMIDSFKDMRGRGPNTPKAIWIRGLIDDDLEPQLTILAKVSVDDAWDMEKEFIKKAKEFGHQLTNSTTAGVGRTKKQRMAYERRIGVSRTPELKTKVSKGVSRNWEERRKKYGPSGQRC